MKILRSLSQVKLKIVYKLMLPAVVSFLLGILFVVMATPQVRDIQRQLTRMEEHFVPALEQSIYNLDHLKNISDKFVFAVLAGEEDMLPDKKEFRIIDKNLADIFDHINDNNLTLPKVKKHFHTYIDSGMKQSTLMMEDTYMLEPTASSKDILHSYHQTLNDFIRIKQLLKDAISSMVERSTQKIQKLLYMTAVFIVLFLVLVFSISFITYRDFHQRFLRLDKKLQTLDIISEERKENAFDSDVLSTLSKRMDDKIKHFQQLQQEALHMQSIAYKDALTNLYNRRYLTLFEQQNHNEKMVYSVMMIDIDNFKKINDNYGHDVGDDILVDVADILVHVLRKDDIALRYGGEEFMVIMQNNDRQIVIDKAEHIRQKIATHRFANVERVTVSIGIALSSEQTFILEELIKYADIALYHVKASGKNAVKLYD